jgi:hypothetical protein
MMINISKQGVTVRTIFFLLVTMFFAASPVSASKATDFNTFVKSREIIATLYFDVDAEDLSTVERKRVANTIQQLRSAQKNGRMIRVEGFSSTEGDQEMNFILSFFRARSVADIIKAEGLDSEISLTGYGDLRADTKDHAKERRVEIASYVTPVGMQKVKVAGNNSTPAVLSNNSAQLKRDTQKIDSYRVEQAIRSKVEKKDGFAEQWDKLDSSLQPGLSQSELLRKEIELGYTLWRQTVAPVKSQKVAQVPSNDLNRSFTRYIRSVTPASSVGLTQAKKADDELKRGYSQVKEATKPETSPGLTQAKNVDDELKRGYSQVKEATTPETSPGLTQSKKADDELKRGYSQVKEATTPETSPGLTQSEKADDELKRGYSQIREAAALDEAPGVTMVVPQAPVIDALMIEQAIMEKIGVKPTVPSGSVSQIDVSYQQ